MLFASVVLGDMLGPLPRGIVGQFASAGFALCAAGLAFRAAYAQESKAARTLRASWACFGAALVAWGLGDLVRAGYGVVYGAPLEPPSAASAVSLAVLPFAIAGNG